MTERVLKNINVFYSTFTNVFFLFLSRFYVFSVFLILFSNLVQLQMSDGVLVRNSISGRAAIRQKNTALLYLRPQLIFSNI